MAKLCAICGINPATTSDHIPPKGIYPKPWDKDINFNTVPSCVICNNGSSAEDEEFKLLMGISTGEYHQTPSFVIDSVAKTIAKNNKIAKKIFDARRVFAYRGSPILEPAMAITFDGEKYSKVISRIIRGLYWMHKGCALGCDYKIAVFPTQNMDASFSRSMKELMDCLQPHTLNKNSIVYKFHFEEDGSSIWGVQFFKTHTVFGYAEAPKT